MSMESHIRSLIAPTLLTMPKECQMVSITEIDLTKESEYITVYISALAEPQLALRSLKKQQARLQASLAALGKKRVPGLRFALDPRTERGIRIEELLQRS